MNHLARTNDSHSPSATANSEPLPSSGMPARFSSNPRVASVRVGASSAIVFFTQILPCAFTTFAFYRRSFLTAPSAKSCRRSTKRSAGQSLSRASAIDRRIHVLGRRVSSFFWGAFFFWSEYCNSRRSFPSNSWVMIDLRGACPCAARSPGSISYNTGRREK